MRFLKAISKWAWIALALLLLLFVLRKLNVLPSVSNIFRSKPVTIDETPVLIKEIRAIAELNTASLYHEFVIDSTVPSIIPLNALKRRIVLIAKGKVTAGIDLQKLDSSNIFVFEDSVSIKLPGARVTGIELNPSSFETFYENGRWSGAEVEKVKMKGKEILLQEAERVKLLGKADEKAKETMTGFLRASGFEKINISTSN